MIGKIISNRLHSKGIDSLPSRNIVYPITVGKSYLIVAITIRNSDKDLAENSVLYQVVNDHGGISHIPGSLVVLEDNRCSSFWHTRFKQDGSILFWPIEFLTDFFHDDLSEGSAAAIDLLKKSLENLENERRNSVVHPLFYGGRAPKS